VDWDWAKDWAKEFAGAKDWAKEFALAAGHH
jgi:hypothetical protein